jgi:beta-glucanase (GH16 family)
MRDRGWVAAGGALLGIVLAAGIVFTASGSRPGALKGETSLMTDDWKIAFYDEFSSGGLDGDRWTTCYWWATDGCNNGSSGELEWYQPGNVTIEDGSLVLTAREEAVSTADGSLLDYTSGMVTTGRATSDLTEEPRFSFTYGRAEIRARVPAGQGLWPAFWLLPVTHESRPEIDVLEMLGHEPTTFRMHYHFIQDGERSSLGQDVTTVDLSAGWHTYAVEWSEDALVWYLDGLERWRIDDPEIVPHEPMYLLLNLAVGGDWPGAPDETTPFPSAYLIDYVRVWQYPPR